MSVVASSPWQPAPEQWATRVAPHLKVTALVVFVVCVVATPSRVWVPYLAHLAVLLTAMVLVRVPLRRLVAGLALELPFVGMALLMPLVAHGERMQVLGVSVSRDGLWGAQALLAKGLLGVLAATLLAATTRTPDLLEGLRRLRVPRQLVDIAGFMTRYLGTVTQQWRRMSIARASRGFRAHSARHWVVLARSIGALFIACYERGERVHLAMLSRGFQGTMPPSARPGRAAAHGGLVLLVPATALLITVAAWWWR